MNKRVVIVSAVRTPIGSFMGGLSTVPVKVRQYIKGALDRII
jgi:acetyl-CoA C-acetyltransferase